MLIYVWCLVKPSSQASNTLPSTPQNHPSTNCIYFCSLTMTYGISTSSSVWSSAVTSKMTFFWCSGTGFLLMNSTSLLMLLDVSKCAHKLFLVDELT